MDRVEPDFAIHNERLIEYLHDHDVLYPPKDDFYGQRTIYDIKRFKKVFERVWRDFYRRRAYPTKYAFHDVVYTLAPH